ncbi:metallophosphoesterase [Lyngbya confervoides]|uniref:Metallophosphoesterase n=1 Tax=Lyngbya confervoides BDU141951 TaxID=1574623 RepID=A0ABD4T337_9CYAN|nr:metallophosphoesterase [Lyngbya confervoides]MCM1983064.1 metallophosphoesterase [Lyngbya confervoides BDU141951]
MPFISQRAVTIERCTVKINGLSPSLDGLRLVQLSDFHFDGQRLSESLLINAIETANQLQPDLVLLTGDYVTDSPDPIFQLVPHLERLKSPYGTHAVLGNHDNYFPHSRTTITQALSSAHINVLWDQVTYLWDHSVALVGLSDYWWTKFNPHPVMANIPADVPRIVLAHNPDTARTLRNCRVDLQLSGHTHGGQVVVPGLGPVVKGIRKVRKCSSRPVRRWLPLLTQNCDKVVQNWEWAQGLHHIGDNRLYVNRGLGSFWPGRMFCPPEVSLLTLTCA